MSWLDRAEKKFRRFAIPGLTNYLAFAQGCMLFVTMSNPEAVSQLTLLADRAINGEWWRFFTFLVLPPTSNPVFAFFGIYFFFLMGAGLEGQWGAFRLNLYILIGYLATIASAFVIPTVPCTNATIDASVFLAFATLYPKFVLYIMFILPVQIRWLALLAWIGYGLSFATGDAMTRTLVGLSVLNYLLFFAGDIWRRIKYGRRKMAEQVKRISAQHVPFHRCAVCGKTDMTDPRLEFRYCSKCGGLGYCEEHINAHEHRTA